MSVCCFVVFVFFFFKQKTAYEMRISDWSSDVCSSDLEQGKHYLFRFWQRLPDPGTIAIFDRSRYGRVLVERVEGLAPEADWRRAYGEINAFERMLRDDGVRIDKIFLHITADEKLDRFNARLDHPFTRWQLRSDERRVGQECVRTGRSRWC